MARSIWKGSIAFGLVNIPVSLTGADARPDIQLHMVDSRNHARIRYERVNADTGDEVPWDQIVRGYEHEDGEFVLLSEDELKAASPKLTKTIEITEFVNLKEIDPLLFDKPSYLEPEKRGRKAYALLREALRKSGKAGISRVVIRTREYLSAMFVRDEVLVLMLLRFPQEIRDWSKLELPSSKEKEWQPVSGNVVDLARLPGAQCGNEREGRQGRKEDPREEAEARFQVRPQGAEVCQGSSHEEGPLRLTKRRVTRRGQGGKSAVRGLLSPAFLPTWNSLLEGGLEFPRFAFVRVVDHSFKTGGAGAMGAAVIGAVPFHSVPDDAAPAALARRCQKMDRALEAVESEGPAVLTHLNAFLVGISAVIANFHGGRFLAGDKPELRVVGRFAPWIPVK